jgi:hypothetical protein
MEAHVTLSRTRRATRLSLVGMAVICGCTSPRPPSASTQEGHRLQPPRVSCESLLRDAAIIASTCAYPETSKPYLVFETSSLRVELENETIEIRRGGLLNLDAARVTTFLNGERFLLDPWGQPMRYRRPGLIHRNGWEMWSSGPNEVDEDGMGDDVVIGELQIPDSSK